MTFNAPKFAVINNVDVKVESSADNIKSALISQLYSPVRWTETVEEMAKEGVTLLVEMGPGKVLTGLTKRIVDSLSACAVNDKASLDVAIENTK